MSILPAENTYCLTENGWLDFFSLEKNEEILTFNSKKLELEFSKIKKYKYYKNNKSNLHYFNNFILEGKNLKLIIDEKYKGLKKVNFDNVIDSKLVFSKIYNNNTNIENNKNLISKIISMNRKERAIFNMACYKNGYKNLGRNGFKYSIFSKKNKEFASAIQLSNYLDGKYTLSYKVKKSNKVIVVDQKKLFSSFHKIIKGKNKDMWEIETKNIGIVIMQNGFITVVG